MRMSGAMLLDHIDHIARVAGEDHVSIGTDGVVLPQVIDAAAIEAARKDYEQRKAAGIAAPGEGPDVVPLVRDYNSIDKLERLGERLDEARLDHGPCRKAARTESAAALRRRLGRLIRVQCKLRRCASWVMQTRLKWILRSNLRFAPKIITGGLGLLSAQSSGKGRQTDPRIRAVGKGRVERAAKTVAVTYRETALRTLPRNRARTFDRDEITAVRFNP
jgi:hypothetical protein